MADYWVSRKKYWCKYCDIFIADDAPSRTQHESGLRHQGNKERFVRNLYKKGERKKKDDEEERREIARIEKAANVAFAEDVAAGRASSSKAQLPSKSAAAPVPSSSSSRKPAGGFDNYSTAESLGYTDPDEAKRIAEIERKRSEGLVGQWEVVAPPPPPLPGSLAPQSDEESRKNGVVPEASDTKPQEIEEEDGPGFKLRKRKLGAGYAEDLWDPGAIPIKLKTPKTDNTDEGKPPSPSSTAPNTTATEKPSWTPMSWKRATGPADSREDRSPPQGDSQPLLNEPSATDTPLIKFEEPSREEQSSSKGEWRGTNGMAENVVEKKEEEEPSLASLAPAAVFRKRKLPGKR